MQPRLENIHTAPGTGSIVEPHESATAVALRIFLRLLFTLGAAGACADLVLIGHVDGRAQQVPLVVLAGGLAVSVWMVVSSRRAPVRVFQTVMMAFIACGLVGLSLHYRANVEFARELTPDRGGLGLFWTAITGASPPSLAPATLIYLGLLGLASTYRHPTYAVHTFTTHDSGEEEQ